MDNIYLIIFSLLLLPGLLGIIIPMLPGIPLMFLVALIFAISTNFKALGLWEIVILGVIAIVSIVVDYFSGILGAKYGGAKKWSLAWGFVGLIVGLFVFPPFGGIIGLFLGILLSELYFVKNQKKAFRAATGGLIGSLAGIIINLILALTFIILFVIFALSRI